MATEQQVAIASKLYEARKSLRRLLSREVYGPLAAKWMGVVQQVAFESHEAGGDTLSAGLELLKRAAAKYDDVAMTWIMAATVELIEPDDETPVVPGVEERQ